MSTEKILGSWKKNNFQPIYWLEGEEDYYIDLLVQYAEHHILSEAEAEFNLTIFYGRDAEWASVTNALKRYPMFAQKQLVLLKEAQHMKDLEKLEPYFSSPLQSTIFIVAYKGKTLDKRTHFFKTIKANTEYFLSAKLRDENVPQWIDDLVKSKGYSIKPKSVALLHEHIGNDLNRIVNEIDKLAVNLSEKKEINEDDIEKYIGISKEYNIFELQAAIVKKDLANAIRIINYFEHNPKAVAIQMALPAMYAHFSKVYAAYGMNEQAVKSLFYNNPAALKQGKDTMKNYGYDGVEKILLILHHYNLKSIGIGDSGTPGHALMKEMLVKMMMS
ncbi:MAG: DNA polymerase III subunit delta [Ferruginibacter sp.]